MNIVKAGLDNLVTQKRILAYRALDLIEAAVTTTTAKPGAAPPRPAKPVRVVRAADLSKQAYLESEQDVETYVGELKRELLAALAGNNRVRVR